MMEKKMTTIRMGCIRFIKYILGLYRDYVGITEKEMELQL